MAVWASVHRYYFVSNTCACSRAVLRPVLSIKIRIILTLTLKLQRPLLLSTSETKHFADQVEYGSFSCNGELVPRTLLDQSFSSSSGLITGACFTRAPIPSSLSLRKTLEIAPFRSAKLLSLRSMKFGQLGDLLRAYLQSPESKLVMVVAGYLPPSSRRASITKADSHLLSAGKEPVSKRTSGQFSSLFFALSLFQFSKTRTAQVVHLWVVMGTYPSHSFSDNFNLC